MPVRLEELRARAASTAPRLPRPGSIPDQVLAWLRSHPEEGWRLSEIAHEIGHEPTSVSPALTRLKGRALVDHLEEHWYALDDAEIAKRHAMVLGNMMANERLGPEDPRDWPLISRD